MIPPLKQLFQAKTTNSENKILPTLQCKNNYSLPQERDDATKNIQQHNCKANWYGLKSWNTL